MFLDSAILNKEMGHVVTFRLFVCVSWGGGWIDGGVEDKILNLSRNHKRENLLIFFTMVR